MNISRKSIAVALGVTLASGVFVGQALAYQEHMHAALDALRTARSELQQAEANKGGHREAAIRLVDQAIDETQAGIDFAR
ncbi:MAG TPA: hypothetical protein VL971_05355 [Rhizomicrobium sp.]|nr:hypothetical protein [Rhizomicrobium sp.]